MDGDDSVKEGDRLAQWRKLPQGHEADSESTKQT